MKVAAVGDPCPIGGTFGTVSPGTLGNSGKAILPGYDGRHRD